MPVAGELAKVMADTYTLYLKTHNYHWNVTGPLFSSLHVMFEDQYTELWTAVDLIAERIRSLGTFAPGDYVTFSRLSSIAEANGVPPAEDMVRDLVSGHEAVACTARAAIGAAEQLSDHPTVDLLVQRIEVHEKAAWMLRSIVNSAQVGD